jgi:hypothetical protein
MLAAWYGRVDNKSSLERGRFAVPFFYSDRIVEFRKTIKEQFYISVISGLACFQRFRRCESSLGEILVTRE